MSGSQIIWFSDVTSPIFINRLCDPSLENLKYGFKMFLDKFRIRNLDRVYIFWKVGLGCSFCALRTST